MARWAIEAHSKVPPTDFCFRITFDFVENGPLLYLPSGTIVDVYLLDPSPRRFYEFYEPPSAVAVAVGF